jgi:hypothetical protein
VNPILYPAIAEVALITYRDVKNKSNVDNPIPHMPIPSQYVSVIIIFGGLALFPGQAAKLASAIGWGFVVATALQVWTPGSTVNSAKAASAAAASAPVQVAPATG